MWTKLGYGVATIVFSLLWVMLGIALGVYGKRARRRAFGKPDSAEIELASFGVTTLRGVWDAVALYGGIYLLTGFFHLGLAVLTTTAGAFAALFGSLLFRFFDADTVAGEPRLLWYATERFDLERRELGRIRFWTVVWFLVCLAAGGAALWTYARNPFRSLEAIRWVPAGWIALNLLIELQPRMLIGFRELLRAEVVDESVRGLVIVKVVGHVLPNLSIACFLIWAFAAIGTSRDWRGSSWIDVISLEDLLTGFSLAALACCFPYFRGLNASRRLRDRTIERRRSTWTQIALAARGERSGDGAHALEDEVRRLDGELRKHLTSSRLLAFADLLSRGQPAAEIFAQRIADEECALPLKLAEASGNPAHVARVHGRRAAAQKELARSLAPLEQACTALTTSDPRFALARELVEARASACHALELVDHGREREAVLRDLAEDARRRTAEIDQEAVRFELARPLAASGLPFLLTSLIGPALGAFAQHVWRLVAR